MLDTCSLSSSTGIHCSRMMAITIGAAGGYEEAPLASLDRAPTTRGEFVAEVSLLTTFRANEEEGEIRIGRG